MNTLSKTLCVVVALALTSSAYALRCKNTLINVGSDVSDVLSNCDVSSDYQVRNTNADIRYLIVKEGVITNKITVIDGVVKSIDY